MKQLRTVVGVLGELLVTAGVVIVLYVVWELGFTAVVETREQHQVVAQLEQELAVPGPATPTTATKPPVGTVFAILRIPRLGGPGWARPVYSGTTRDILAKGLGYYPTTAVPGQPGNTAVVG
ncbi:MAG TPA: sortase [Candidatus Lustribacter sp.]|nr:sortase [Candidatus Lustribacter sp.]